jgi:hypothetical protein
MLEQELDYYKKHLNELRANNPQGGFVVIKEESLLGIWFSRQDAIRAGVEKLGTDTIFLVKDINEPMDHKINYSRNIKFVNAVSNTQNQ